MYKRQLEGKDPLEVAGKQLEKDRIDILHTIGGDDTNTMAAALAKHLEKSGNKLTVVGLPKTVDNDVIPVKQTLGAWTAAEQGARFFQNIVNENTTSRRQLIIHEVMGRHCGWHTAGTAYEYRKSLENMTFLPELSLSKERWDVHAIYIPEIDIDFQKESQRLRKCMDENDCVNIFLSEGAGLDAIIDEMKANNEEIRYDAFGHVRLDEINPGQWFAKQFATELNAEKVLVQKSGYFARSASPNQNDISLIDTTSEKAVNYALANTNGVIALSDESNQIECIDFSKIKGRRFWSKG